MTLRVGNRHRGSLIFPGWPGDILGTMIVPIGRWFLDTATDLDYLTAMRGGTIRLTCNNRLLMLSGLDWLGAPLVVHLARSDILHSLDGIRNCGRDGLADLWLTLNTTVKKWWVSGIVLWRQNRYSVAIADHAPPLNMSILDDLGRIGRGIGLGWRVRRRMARALIARVLPGREGTNKLRRHGRRGRPFDGRDKQVLVMVSMAPHRQGWVRQTAGHHRRALFAHVWLHGPRRDLAIRG